MWPAKSSEAGKAGLSLGWPSPDHAGRQLCLLCGHRLVMGIRQRGLGDAPGMATCHRCRSGLSLPPVTAASLLLPGRAPGEVSWRRGGNTTNAQEMGAGDG